jgi:hypothetical protein
MTLYLPTPGIKFRVLVCLQPRGWRWRVLYDSTGAQVATGMVSGPEASQEAAEWAGKDWIFGRCGETVSVARE